MRVVGDGRDDCLLEVRRCRGVAAHAACGLARDAESWGALRAAFGGEVAVLGPDYVVFAGEQVVVVPLGAGRAPAGVVVSSEEGVDVLTIDAVAGAPGQCEALVLHANHRKPQRELSDNEQRHRPMQNDGHKAVTAGCIAHHGDTCAAAYTWRPRRSSPIVCARSASEERC